MKKRYGNRDFRDSAAWKKKKRVIKARDNYMCQACIRKLSGTIREHNTEQIEVHHIIPLEKNRELGLEDSNLICLCRYHHEQAEQGIITREIQQTIAREQEERYCRN